tara:strand:+ start:4037 stop:5329 length:1293 start_codon:yes stop_codon:yes gene_type:complete
MKKNTLDNKEQHLFFLLKKLKNMHNTKSHVLQITQLLQKIRRLIAELVLVVAPDRMRKIIGTAIILLGISSTSSFGQSFLPPVANAFGLTNTYNLALPAFADLDNDGDLDLLVGESYGVMQYFQNMGTSVSPQFAAPIANPFGLDSTYYIAFPTFADLDNDGDLDLLVGEYYGAMQYFQNTGTSASPQFAAPVANPFGLTSVYQFAFPTFADLDNDGDFDLLVGEYYGVMQYFQNTGTATAPQFAAPVANSFGLTSTYQYAFPTFADLDNDGDLDLLVGEYYGAMQYFQNTGTTVVPQFTSPITNPFGLISVYEISTPVFADLDNDGDFDLLVGSYGGSLPYFENDSVVGLAENSIINATLFPNPVTSMLTIESEDNVSKIEITNSEGKIVATFNSSNSVNVSDLKTGFYIANITFSNSKYKKHLKFQKL